MSIQVRSAYPADDVTIERIEIAADDLLIDRFAAVHWPPPTSAEERASTPGFVLVADKREGAAPANAVGFAHVLETEGQAHLEQLSVLPEHGRRGIGRQLVQAALTEALRRGHSHVTLRTYADVPWNAPFYASCGFIETDPDSDFLRGLVATEESLRLGRYGRRVQMTVVL